MTVLGTTTATAGGMRHAPVHSSVKTRAYDKWVLLLPPRRSGAERGVKAALVRPDSECFKNFH